MAPVTSLWTATSLQRYRFPIIALACLAAGATIYYAQTSQTEVESTPKRQENLHRSNASHRARRTRAAGVPPESEEQTSWEQALATEGRLNPQVTDGGETENDVASEFSWERQDEDKEEEDSKDGESLLLLLYRIADEQSRTNGYVHRGVACDSCNENPIRGIRYCCVNCADHDLCETCESTQTHNRQHLFLKIRIPAPQLGTHKERQPVFYPGKPRATIQDLRKEEVDKFCKETGYKSEEVDAFWEQFRSMAATEWPDDPDHYGLAIDRPTFDQCFVPSALGRLPPPNLIYGRIFSYYDTNDDGLIGFAEFIEGLASLKRNNMAERMKRVFKGFDINNDGYVDRKDFLKMFRAYYAHIKELMGDIVASMQDDDDQDARELVSGGQPISSAFNGPGSTRSGDVRCGGMGKVQNNFGDHEIVDDMGAVDEHEFNPDAELDNIIFENMEAARWPTNHPISRSDFPRSGRAIQDFIMKSSRDKVVSLMEYYGLRDVVCESSIGEDAEKKYRRTLHGKLADELRRRRVDRHDAIKQRSQKQLFYKHKELLSSPLDTSQDERERLVDRRLPTQMESDFEDVLSFQAFDEFNGQVIELVESLDWPVEKASDFNRAIYDMVARGYNSSELSSNLDGYSTDSTEVEKFVSSFVELLSRMASKVRQGTHRNPDPEKLSKFVKSSSTSKVRFEERPGTDKDGNNGLNVTNSQYSKSRPFNERWGAFEAPGPETDVGRETLYAVTEEALNELLDPVFRLSEDLALRALHEQKKRAKYRTNIIAAVPGHQGLRDVKLYLERYSRRWRETKDHPPPPPRDHDDETVCFAIFVDLMVSGKVTSGNGTKCTECLKRSHESWVRIGEYCTRTQYHSQRPTGQPEGRRLVDEITSPAEMCPMCAQMGKDSSISGLYCNNCGQPCSRLIEEEAKIRNIIETGAETPYFDPGNHLSKVSSLHERASSTNQPSLEEGDDEETPSPIPAQEEPSSSSEDFPTPYNIREKPSIPEARAGYPKSLDDAKSPSIPDSVEPNKPVAAYTDTTSYPHMAQELHSSVATFNTLDPARLEATIASKPLDDLLAESGYTSTRTDPLASKAASPDPTLPQNRPSAIPSSHQASSPQATSLPSPPSPPPSSSLSSQSSPSRNMKERLEPLEGNFNTNATDNHNSEVRPDPDTDPEAPTEAQCKFYACLDLVEAEDWERGGPGRINFEEFEEIMMGEKGASLGFLASWVEVGAF